MITKPTRAPAHTDQPPRPAPSHRTPTHPVWCDLTRCTADPASQAVGYRPGVGGEHRSAPIPLNFTTAMWLPVRDGTAWLSQACAPWECAVYLRVQVGDLELSVAVDCAAPVLNALVTLLAPTASVEEVRR